MRKITRLTVAAFLDGRSLRIGNTFTDGTFLYLFGNAIAHKREDGIYVNLAGWNTRTTINRLNAIPGVLFTREEWGPCFRHRKCGVREWIKV